MNNNNSERTHTISEVCADVFSLILSLQASSDFGEVDTIRNKTIKLLEEIEKKAEESNIAADDVQDAKFALVAFIDETIVNSPWPSRNVWRLLQRRYFNTNIAGDRFFEKLDEIRTNPSKADVLEIYYLCLMLGFKGRLERGSKEEYRNYIDGICENIKSKPIDKLSPNWVQKFIVIGRRKTPWWVWATLGTYVIVIVIILITIFKPF